MGRHKRHILYVDNKENKMSIENQIIQMTSYQLTDSAEAFTKAISALSQRTQEEGPENILRYSFYVNAGDGTAGSIIVYRDPEA